MGDRETAESRPLESLQRREPTPDAETVNNARFRRSGREDFKTVPRGGPLLHISRLAPVCGRGFPLNSHFNQNLRNPTVIGIAQERKDLPIQKPLGNTTDTALTNPYTRR